MSPQLRSVSPMGLRPRALLLVLLPSIMLSCILGTVFIGIRVDDSRQALHDQARLTAHYLALATEFGVLSNNPGLIAQACSPVFRENGSIIGVKVLDQEHRGLWEEGQPIALARTPVAADPEISRDWLQEETSDRIVYRSPIFLTGIAIEDDATTQALAGQPPRIMGHVLVALSKQQHQQHLKAVLLLGLLIVVVALLITVPLARRFSNHLIHPILQIQESVARLASGQLDARIGAVGSKELSRLAEDINVMAETMQRSHARLHREVAKATANLQQALSQQREQNLELRLERQRADAASHAKDEFLARMSHELRTPLNAVIGMSELTLETRLDDRQRNYLEKIHLSAQALVDIINEILDFSKIEAGRLELVHSEFALNDVLNHLTSVVAVGAQHKGLEFSYCLDPKIPARLVGDATRLGQILINLCGNAVKFTEQGEIIVKLRQIGATAGLLQLEIAVCDTGIGIPQADQARLFEPFIQMDSSLTRRYQGTGLGLAICQTLVRKMDGELHVSSQEGQGSTFSFTLWLGIPDPASASTALPVPEYADLHLLLIDSHPGSALCLQTMMQALGCEVTCVTAIHDTPSLAVLLADPHLLLMFDWRTLEDNVHDYTRVLEAEELLDRRPLIWLMPAEQRERPGIQTTSRHEYVLQKPVTLDALAATLSAALRHEPIQRAAFPVPDAATGLAGQIILLVEDNLLNQELVMDLLTSQGMRVITANHGAEALALLEQNRVDLVLMDIQMPVMDGYATTRAIRQEPWGKTLPIVALSANTTPAGRGQALAAGMDDYLSKPISKPRLFASLHQWLIQPAPPAAPEAPPPAPRLPEWPESQELQVGECLESNQYPLELYRRLLDRFIEDQCDFAAQFNASLSAGDMASCTRIAHTLKGGAGTIGAYALQDRAMELEQACKAPLGVLMPLLRKTRQHLGQVLVAVDQALNHPSLQPSLGSGTDHRCAKARLREVLPEIHQALMQQRWEAIELVEALAQDCAEGPAASVFKELQQATHQFNYPLARSLCQELASRMGLPWPPTDSSAALQAGHGEHHLHHSS